MKVITRDEYVQMRDIPWFSHSSVFLGHLRRAELFAIL